MEYVTYPPLDIEYTIVFFLITKGGIKGGFRKINSCFPHCNTLKIFENDLI
jgi:hypothetical protein